MKKLNVSIICLLALCLAVKFTGRAFAADKAASTQSGEDQGTKKKGKKPLWWDVTKAEVNIPFEGEKVKVTVEIPGFPPPSSFAMDGMSALRLEDWDKAIEKFKEAIKEKSDKWQYHLALAVAAEVKGDYELAKEHYAEADRWRGKDGLLEARNGIKRIKARGK